MGRIAIAIVIAGVALSLAACSGPASSSQPADAVADPPQQASPAPAADADSRALPVCAADDARTVVPVWTPSFDDEGDLSSDPPQGDGLVVYADLQRPSSPEICGEDALHAFTRPGNTAEGYPGGLAVNLRGNVGYADGSCRLQGYYVNRDVPGMHQGWIETYFEAVDAAALFAEGRHCLERALP